MTMAANHSLQPRLPTMAGNPQLGLSDAKNSHSINYLLTLHFLGLGGLPGAGWLERPPGYELIVQAGGTGKRVHPRIPAPPPGVPGGGEDVDLNALMPDCKEILRIDERLSMRLPEPAPFLQVDVWEERLGLLDFSSKAPAKKLLGQCYVPLDPKFSRRPCTWSIVSHSDKERSPLDVGFLTCKFGLATSPMPVRNLRVVEGAITSSEICLAWDVPVSDGGMPLRGYRIEACSALRGSAAGLGCMQETPRTASAPPAAQPSVTMRNLRGNTSYAFRVWATSEAGPGPSAEVLARTGPVAPGVCGLPRALGADTLQDDAPLYVEWSPPADTGGATVVAYRLWLRPIFQDSLGNFYPADGWIDLGLFEHKGNQLEMQRAPIQRDALPACSGCVCSVAALNAAGHTGASTHEAPIFFDDKSSDVREIFELNSPESGAWSERGNSHEGGSGSQSVPPVPGRPSGGGHSTACLEAAAARLGACGGGLPAEPVHAPYRPQQMRDDPLLELPPPRRSSPVTTGSTEETTPGTNGGGSDLYSQAVRALRRSSAAASASRFDAPSMRLAPTQEFAPPADQWEQAAPALGPHEVMSRLDGGVYVETLQCPIAHRLVNESLVPGAHARPMHATYGLGAKGALVAGRPKPATD